MSTNRYAESQGFSVNSRFPTSGVHLPVSNLSEDLPRDISGRPLQERLRNQDTTVRWINDSVTGQEKFQVTVNIDGFHQNEVKTRVEGRKLIVYGEHIETKNQSTAKKIIEKTYELPQDIDPSNPRVTFSGLNTMQIEFFSRYSNVIHDNGRSTSNIATTYDLPIRSGPTTGFQQERSSSEFTSTRKIGGTNKFDDRDRTQTSTVLSSPDRYLPYEDLIKAPQNNRRVHFDNDDSHATSNFRSGNRTYETIDDSFSSGGLTTNLPTWRGENTNRVFENSFTESRREFEQRRSSPSSGVQTTREVEHHQSGRPIIEPIRTVPIAPSPVTGISGSPMLTKRNTEVQEFSRRIGTGLDGNAIGATARGSILPLLPLSFNSDAFYRSAFQPQIFTDERGEKSVEMKLNVSNFKPSEVKVSVTQNDLIVRAEHNDERLPTSKSRSYFYKQVTLPPNTDLNSLASDYLPDGTLSIKAKLFPEQTAIRHNY